MSSRPNTPALCHSPTINYLQSLSIKYLDPSQMPLRLLALCKLQLAGLGLQDGNKAAVIYNGSICGRDRV